MRYNTMRLLHFVVSIFNNFTLPRLVKIWIRGPIACSSCRNSNLCLYACLSPLLCLYSAANFYEEAYRPIGYKH